MANSTNTLHCALVWEKCVLDERVMNKSFRISVGEGAGNTFSVQSAVCGKRHCLIRHKPRGTVLILKEGMQGKVRISGQIKEVSQMTHPDVLTPRKGSSFFYNLSDGDEGILVFGRTGLVFRIGLEKSISVKAGLRYLFDYNPLVSRIFSLSLLLVLFSSFITRLIAQPMPVITVEHLPDRLVSLIVRDPEAASAFRKELSRRKIEKRKTRSKSRTSSPANRNTRTKKSSTSKQINGRGMLGALVEARDTQDALREVMNSVGLESDLNKAVRKLDQGGANAKVLMSTGNDGILAPNSAPRNGRLASNLDNMKTGAVVSTGTTGRRLGRRNRLSKRKQTKVVVYMPSSGAKTSGGSLSKIEIFEVVNRNQGAIRYCYESQLARYPSLKGELTADFIIDINGRVKKVIITNNRLSPQLAKNRVAKCMIRFMTRWRFPKPRGGKVRVIYPFRFGQVT